MDDLDKGYGVTLAPLIRGAILDSGFRHHVCDAATVPERSELLFCSDRILLSPDDSSLN